MKVMEKPLQGSSALLSNLDFILAASHGTPWHGLFLPKCPTYMTHFNSLLPVAASINLAPASSNLQPFTKPGAPTAPTHVISPIINVTLCNPDSLYLESGVSHQAQYSRLRAGCLSSYTGPLYQHGHLIIPCCLIG